MNTHIEESYRSPRERGRLLSGSNGVSLFYLAQSIYRTVDLYCNKINHHIWQALMESIKDDTISLTFVASVSQQNYSQLWKKLCSRWLDNLSIRKSKHLDQFNQLIRLPKESFKEYFHRLELVVNTLSIEFDYIVPEEQIILKVLQGVDTQLQSLYLQLRSANVPIFSLCYKLIDAEAELLLTKNRTLEGAFATSRVRLCYICKSPDHVKADCPNHTKVKLNNNYNRSTSSFSPNFRGGGRINDRHFQRNSRYNSHRGRGRHFYRGRGNGNRDKIFTRGNHVQNANNISTSVDSTTSNNTDTSNINNSTPQQQISCNYCNGSHYTTSCPVIQSIQKTRIFRGSIYYKFWATRSMGNDWSCHIINK
jgi:hypothetical protein